MTDLTPEKRAELRAECVSKLAYAKKFRNFLPFSSVETLDLAALLDALNARESELERWRRGASSSALSEAKLQALVDMHHTSMRHRKYGREPEWLGAAFTELRAKYEAEAASKPQAETTGESK